MVSLVVEHIFRKSFEWLQVRNEFPKESRVLLLEKFNVCNDLRVHFESNLALNSLRELIQDVLGSSKIKLVPRVVGQKVLDHILNLLREVCPLRVFIKRFKLDVEL